MNIILFDELTTWQRLLPLTYTRPVSEIRIGILTIREKWELYMGSTVSYFTKDYLSKKYPLHIAGGQDNVIINSKILPSEALAQSIKQLKPGQGLRQGEVFIVFNSGSNWSDDLDLNEILSNCDQTDYPVPVLDNVWEIFTKNGTALEEDFKALSKGRASRELSPTNRLIGPADQLFIEEGAKIEGAILNTGTGPIYIGKDAEIMEGSVVRGPFALCEHSTLKLSAKVYGPTTIGPHSKAGGEISNSIIFGYSNKGHDGFLGNSVLGEWCNLGADTNNSNLKNNYGNVKLYSYATNGMEDTGLQFCGLIMGDHSKCGINTMFNTGTVVGVGANIFGGNFPPNHVPSFAWGGAEGFETYKLNKMIETANRVLARRNTSLSPAEEDILNEIFSSTGQFRQWS